MSIFFQKSSHVYSKGLLVLGFGGGSGGEGMEVVEIGKDPPLHRPLDHYHRHQLTRFATKKKKKKRRDLGLRFFFFFAKIWGFVLIRIGVGAIFLFLAETL